MLPSVRDAGRTLAAFEAHVREIRRVLLDADVNYKVAKDFIEEVSVKALGEKVIASISPGQLITKIINDELRITSYNVCYTKLLRHCPPDAAEWITRLCRV